MPRVTFQDLVSDRVRIRRFTDDDAAAFRDYRNDPDVARYQSWISYTDEEAAEFVAIMKSTPVGIAGFDVQLAIERHEDELLIGDCYLAIDRHERRQAEIGFTLARQCQGQGYATEAITLLLDYLFDVHKLHRITATADTRNTASVALMERLGMRREAHFREHLWFKGEWADDYVYAILSDEWSARRTT
jgi:aminoglycoside 6'-N-acetyltransferase